MSEPVVSVIIPTYNRSQYLVESLESVLAQKFQPFEIVVVDDGSTDETQEILSRYKGRVVSICQPNAGFAAARTRGVQEARSQLIAFHDSDDLMLRGRLAAQVSFMHEHPKVAVVSGNAVIQRMEEMDYLENCGLQFGNEGWIIIENAFQQLLKRNFMVDPASMIRREYFFEIGGYDLSLRSSADWDLWLRMSRKWPLACMKMPCVWVRKHETNLSSSPAENACNIQIIDRALRSGGTLDKDALKIVLKRLSGQIRGYVVQNLMDSSESDWVIDARRCAKHLTWYQQLFLRLVIASPRKFLRFLLGYIIKIRRAFR